MGVLYRKLRSSNQIQTRIFVIISILNVVIIGIFMKLMVEINKIMKVTAEVSRDEELIMYLYLLIAVAAVIILFSLWIIQIICQTIFETRKEFNIQLRLIGVTRKMLSSMYTKEFLEHQVLAVLCGTFLMEVGYCGISYILDIDSHWISPCYLLLAVALHLISILVCIKITLSKITKFNPLEEMRKSEQSEKVKNFRTSDVITGIIGLICIVYGLLFAQNNMMLMILPIVGIFLDLDFIVLGAQMLIKKAAMKIGVSSLSIGSSIQLGYYRRTSPIITTLTVGLMISFGLLGMFETIRVIAHDTVEQNMYFTELIVHSDVKEHWNLETYQEIVKELDPGAEIAYGINLEMTDSDNIINTVYAVDSEYCVYGEKFVLTDGTEVKENLDSNEFDGIYLPDYFISDDDIGKDYSLSINNNTVTFKIAGRFIANGSRGRYGFVSRSYLQSVMGTDMINALYIHKANQDVIDAMENGDNVISKYVVTKENIANNSYDNAINGVEIFEIAAFMIIGVSLLMFVHFVFSTSQQNIFDISRLRAMGMKRRIIKRVYRYQVVSIFTVSALVGAILAYLFIRVGISMSLSYIDVPVHIKFPIGEFLGIYVLLLVIGMVVMHMSTVKAYKEGFIKQLLVAE